MKVYVVESGDYENRGVEGVYSSEEKAKASIPDAEWEKLGEHDNYWIGRYGAPDLTGWRSSASVVGYELDLTWKPTGVGEGRR